MRQMLADCLTKEDQRAADYLRFVLKSGRYRLTKTHDGRPPNS